MSLRRAPLRLLLAVLLALAAARASAEVRHETQAWQAFFLTGPIYGPLKWYAEGHLRSSDEAGGPFTEIARPALWLDLGPHVGLYAGHAWVWRQTGRGTTLELRPWQQAFLHHRLGPFSLSHRLRLEERFLPDGAFSLRFRYFLRVAAPVSGRIWLGTMQEVFVQDRSPTFDQHRAFFGPSITWQRGSRLDVGYQLIVLAGGDRLVLGHAVAVFVFQNF